MSTALLIIGCIALFVPCYARFGLLHPLTLTVALWLSISLLFAAHPADLVPPRMRVAAAILLGLTALAMPSLLLGRSPRREAPSRPGENPRAPVPVTFHVGRLVLVTVIVLGIVGWGVVQYRSAISAALGRPFGEADAKLVRWAELYGDLALSGSVGVAMALAPLLGAFAVIGGLCHRWWWYLLLPVALTATMQSPSRTATVTVLVTSVFFFVLLSRTPGLPRRRPPVAPSHWRTASLFSFVGALGLVYFSFVGQALEKSEVEPGLRTAGWLPDFLVQPLLYQLGSVSAFSAALDEPPDGEGPYGAFGRSVYAVVKLVQLVGVDIPTPAPFASYVEIPIPFNTYTAFGDAYFDFGLTGVLVVFLFTGLALHTLTVWPRRGHPGSAWALSMLMAVLTATPIHMRVLDGDILIPAAIGCAMVAFVLRPATARTAGPAAVRAGGPMFTPRGVPPTDGSPDRGGPTPSGRETEARGR
ncbi:O-antigen polymerase [Blastococcus mobilis]|uniref:Oligosaccharide repeat unit polymerase n=1 Tax=Blastococcus mobilis TaxID=1938746 RepID=A0A238Z0V9_9ACTN|nr:O-antigen polymerase [Blastococcus mobilis]SNR77020.1 oligosaccharide repeat unit polymerase [Blastococcus mobilis]